MVTDDRVAKRDPVVGLFLKVEEVGGVEGDGEGLVGVDDDFEQGALGDGEGWGAGRAVEGENLDGGNGSVLDDPVLRDAEPGVLADFAEPVDALTAATRRDDFCDQVELSAGERTQLCRELPRPSLTDAAVQWPVPQSC